MTKDSGRIPLGPGGEFDLIRALTKGQGPLSPGVVLGSGDDCAILEGGLVVSADLSVEGVHFRRDWLTLEEIGYRATAAALSDLAAMAAEPLGILFAMALNPTQATNCAAELQRGASRACEREGIQVIGGDLAGSPGPVTLDVVALGRAESPVLRSGAEVGDEVWVTGWLGGSSAAVSHWTRGEAPTAELREVFAQPSPRIREALWLAEHAPLHCLIDLSDGLAGDAGHLAAASGLSFVLEENMIPVHAGIGDPDPFRQPDPLRQPGPLRQSGPLHFALAGGEDYELCFTVPPQALEKWVAPFQDSFGIPLTRIGEVKEGGGVFLKEEDGRLKPVGRGGFSHFSVEEEE